MSVLYLMHLCNSLILERGTDHTCSSVSRQLGSFCRIMKGLIYSRACAAALSCLEDAEH